MMQGHFAVLSSKCNICCIPNSTSTTFIPLNSQRKMISCNIKYIFVDKEIYYLGVWKFEKRLFNFYFLNYDISLNNTFRHTIFSILIDNIYMEGTVSQIFYIGPGFCSLKCRKFIQNFFLHKIKTKA